MSFPAKRQDHDALELAQHWYGQGELHDAADACTSLLRRDPAHPGALRLLARSYLGLGAFSEAIQILSQIDRIGPDEGWLFVAFGHVTLAKGDPAMAAQHFERAIAMGEDGPAVRAFLSTALRRAGQVDDAADVAAEALETSPDAVPLLLALAEALALTDPGAAVQTFETVLALADDADSGTPDVVHAQARIGLLQSGQRPVLPAAWTNE